MSSSSTDACAPCSDVVWAWDVLDWLAEDDFPPLLSANWPMWAESCGINAVPSDVCLWGLLTGNGASCSIELDDCGWKASLSNRWTTWTESDSKYICQLQIICIKWHCIKSRNLAQKNIWPAVRHWLHETRTESWHSGRRNIRIAFKCNDRETLIYLYWYVLSSSHIITCFSSRGTISWQNRSIDAGTCWFLLIKSSTTCTKAAARVCMSRVRLLWFMWTCICVRPRAQAHAAEWRSRVRKRYNQIHKTWNIKIYSANSFQSAALRGDGANLVTMFCRPTVAWKRYWVNCTIKTDSKMVWSLQI